MSDWGLVDTRFRTALRRLDSAGRLLKVRSRLDPHLEVAGLMHRYDGDLAMLFEQVGDYSIPVCANFLVSPANVKAVFEQDLVGIRACMERGLAGSLKPRIVGDGPCQEVAVTQEIDLEEMFPVLFHACGDGGKYITGGVVIAQDPERRINNASIHRLYLLGADRAAIKLDWGRHLRALYEKAQQQRIPLEIAVVIGGDMALNYAAATMGSQVPLERDELDVASAIKGEPLDLVRCRTVNLAVPAEAEIVLEGEILPDQSVQEGPFIEFLGLYSEVGPSPVVRFKAATHRREPFYYAICGQETTALRKFILEVAIMRSLRAAVPMVRDVNLTDGGLNRFHLVISVHKTKPEDEGFQRNAIFAAITAVKDLDLVIVVDDDINIHDPKDVEYALATRMEASRDLFLMPGARGHEYVPVSEAGARTKVGIDATVPVPERERFRRVAFKEVDLNDYEHSLAPMDRPLWVGERGRG
ncbi:MAG: UbiD family decarboxylase [Dehalococcoidia bacterium]